VKKLLALLVVGLGITGAVVASQPSVSAMGLIGGQNSNYIKADEVVDGSAFLAGESVTVDGTIKGDLYCAAQDVTVTGTVEGDILCAGKTITLAGKAHNVRVAGQYVHVRGSYAGSVSAVAQSVDMESSARIAGDLTGGASDISIAGVVGRDVVMSSSSFILTGQVARDVTGRYETSRITKDATIGGVLDYTSDKDADIAGHVAGAVVRHAVPAEERSSPLRDAEQLAVWMLGCVVAAVVVAVVAPRKLRAITTLRSGQDMLAALGIGVLAVFVAPVVCLVLAFTVVGIPLACIGAVAWLALVAVSWPVVAYYMGQRLFASRGLKPVVATMCGALVLAIIGLVPVINTLVMISTIVFGAGMIVYAVRAEHAKPRRHKS